MVYRGVVPYPRYRGCRRNKEWVEELRVVAGRQVPQIVEAAAIIT